MAEEIETETTPGFSFPTINWRLVILAVLLAVSIGAAVIGISQWSAAAAWVTAGALGTVWSWLFFGEAGDIE